MRGPGIAGNGGRRVPGRMPRAMICAWAAAVAVLVAGAAVLVAGSAGGDAIIAQREGRISVNLQENGSLAVAGFGGERLGVRWPGIEGSEFLGSGGFFLRFRRGEGAPYTSVAPWDFRKIESGARLRASEGCEGGKRYPHRMCDDDNDGAIDEDPIDGRDNDGDGAIDEDFAAIGDGMVVTRAVEPSSGLVLGQSSYTWNYGHVRDFIGFTTLLEYPEGRRDREGPIRDLEIALYTDFDIGAPDHELRGSDDRFFFMGGPASAEGSEAPLNIPVASEQSTTTAYVAVLVLDAAGPAEAPLDVEPFIVTEYDRADSLWNGLAAAQTAASGSERPQAGAAYRRLPSTEDGFSVYGAVEGDRAVAYRIGPVRQLKVGGRVRIEWALVFGASRRALARNIRRAVETYRGVTDEGGTPYHWIVPARRAVRRELGMTLASVFSDGRRQPAAGIDVPPDLETEEVEWIRIDGALTTRYERVGAKIVIPLDRALVTRSEPFTVEGQLTDGTIFTAKPSAELLQAFGMNEELPPGRLADDQMHLFPNPFLTALTIDVNIPTPSVYANSTGGAAEGASSVRIYDVKGRLVRTVLEEEFLHPGSYQLGWDGLDDTGGKAAPGVYYCKLQIGERSLTKRVILLR